jgi:hypothetical protein
MTERDLTRAEVEALLDGTTEGPWLREAQGIYADNGRKLVASVKSHECGIAWPSTEANGDIIAAAPTLARQLLRYMDERDTFERQLKGVLDREAETYVRLENKIETAEQLVATLEAENARLRDAAARAVKIHKEAKEFGAFRSTKFTTALSLAVSDLCDALQPAPTVTAGWPTEEGEGSIIVGETKGPSHD